jgi:multicomponent K+:H+ antiporter subunit A
VLVGVAPGIFIGPSLAAAARPVVGGVLPDYSLAVWHGFTLPLVMSLVAISVGITGYVWLRKQHRNGRFHDAPVVERFNGRRLFDGAIAWLTLRSRSVLRIVSTRRLQPQVFAIIVVAMALALLASRGVPLEWGDRPRVPASYPFVLLWIIGMVCGVGAAVMAKYHRLVAITLMGGAGLVTCLTFVWFSAPDLAITQLVVEVVTTILLLLGLRWLPMRREDMSRRLAPLDWARRSRDLLVAVGAGSGLAALSYAMLTRPTPQRLAPFFLGRALPEGGGTNVVNIILVDFRAFDTMGEITVLCAVALAVYALLRRFRPPEESIEVPRQQQLPRDIVTDLVKTRTADEAARGYMMVPAVIARLVLPIAIVVAAHLFLRGHNEPGGGFVAGLVVAIAFLMQYIASGTEWVEGRTRLHPVRWLSVGLLLVAMTGLGAIVLGYPFLTTHTAHVILPVIGEVHLPSATIFDLGVFAVVVGAILLILTALAHQSTRAHRPKRQDPSAEREDTR